MEHLVIFVVPFYKPTVGQFLQPFTRMPGVRLALISQDPVHNFPTSIRSDTPLAQIDDITNLDSLLAGARYLMERFGRPFRILAINEQVQLPVAQLRQILDVDGMSVETITRFRDKGKMKEAFREAGVPCARHVSARSRKEAWDFVEDVGYPVCVKPVDGAAAQATFKVKDKTALTDILRASAPSREVPLQIEEFVTGEEQSFETLAVNGECLYTSVSHYYPPPLNVMRNPWIQWNLVSPREINDSCYDDIRKANEKALHSLGMGTGMTHLEWFRRPDGTIAINEVAARPPGAQLVTLMNRAHDIDLFTIWAKLMVWETLEPIPPRKYAAGAVFLRGLGGQAVQSVEGLEVLDRYADMITDTSIPKLGDPAGHNYEGEGYILVRHPETGRVKEALSMITNEVRICMF